MASRHRKTIQKRTECLLIVFAVLYLLIGGRLAQIQVLANQRYLELAEKLRLRQVQIPAQRGLIYDRSGCELAINLMTASIYAQPPNVKNKREVARSLSQITGLSAQSILDKLNSDSKFIWIVRRADISLAEKVKELNAVGVGVQNEPKRIYPLGQLAAHVIGFTNTDGHGLEGIESACDKYLNGTNGFVVAEVDAGGRFIPETRKGMIKPIDGNDVVLTIDSSIQHIAEEALDKACAQYNPAGATAIVMDPATGEVLALVNRPVFNPNDRRNTDPGAWRNRAVTDLYEPGSTLKMITAAAALEEGISPTASISQCTGRISVGRRSIRCVLHAPYLGGHGSVDLNKMICYSCNIAAAEAAMKLGPEKLYKYEQAFGLLDKPGTLLRGESCGRLDDPSKWASIRLANIGFGQGIVATPIQMVSAYSAVANGGVLMHPRIVREIRRKDGTVIRAFKPEAVRRVMSRENAAALTNMLENCVVEGTGKPAGVKGYTVAGKTGSAQKASSTGRGYAAGKFIASFIGFAPANNPKLVIGVIVDEPKRCHWGATVAAPVFHEIAAKTLWYLKVPPDHPSADVNGAREKEKC